MISAAIFGAAAGTGLALVAAMTIVVYRYYAVKRKAKYWSNLDRWPDPPSTRKKNNRREADDEDATASQVLKCWNQPQKSYYAVQIGVCIIANIYVVPLQGIAIMTKGGEDINTLVYVLPFYLLFRLTELSWVSLVSASERFGVYQIRETLKEKCNTYRWSQKISANLIIMVSTNLLFLSYFAICIIIYCKSIK